MKTLAGLVILFFCFSFCLGSTIRKETDLFDSATWIQTDEMEVLGSGEGSDSSFFLWGMIPVTTEPSLEKAMSQILEKFPDGKGLTNIQIYREDKAYFPLGMVIAIHVKAKVVGSKKTKVQ